MMLLLAVLLVAMLIVAVAFCIEMFRRDDPMLGLTALVVAVLAAFPAVLYGGINSL
jgi:ABC-type phosphate transport system permease subunit